MDVKIIEHHLITPSVTGYTIETPQGFDYIAGQFINVEIPVLNCDNRCNKRNSSLVSAPYEPNLMISMRHGVSRFKQTFENIPIGTIIKMTGPLGHFTLKEDDAPVVMISGGIGITALYSMVKDATRRKLSKHIRLLYSNTTQADVPFYEHLKQCARDNPNFKFILTLTQEPEDSGWTGKRGRIDEAMIKEVTQNTNTTTFYICGPVGMVLGLKKVLVDLGIPFERLKTELFTGYP